MGRANATAKCASTCDARSGAPRTPRVRTRRAASASGGVTANVSLEVSAVAPNHADAVSAPFRLGPSETRGGLELRLVRAGSIEVIATGSVGTPVVARARAVDVEGRETIAEMVRGRSVVLEGIAPGEWEVTLSSFGRGATSGQRIGEPKRIEVKAGERAQVELPRE
jgi:hypothetical protein